MFAVRADFVGKKKGKVDYNFVAQKINQLISLHLVRKTGYEAGTGILRLLSKDSNTVFSRHIQTGCNLQVCITTGKSISAFQVEPFCLFVLFSVY